MDVDLVNLGLIYSDDDFYNTENKIEFISEKFVNYSDKSKQQILNVFKKIGDVEKQYKKDIALFNFDEIKFMFEENKWISSGVVENKQSLIREYMRWYRGKGLDNWQECNTPDTIDRIEQKRLSGNVVFQSEWFRSIGELQSEIDVLFDAYGGVDDHELDLGITLLYLAWYDVDSEESIKIKKRSISMAADQIYLPISERFIDLAPKPMQFIREYMESEGYNVVVKGNNLSFRKYKSSDYLLRSTRSDQMTENNNRSILSKLSDLYEESGKSRRFKYDRIQTSGIYSRLIEYEKQNGEFTTRDVDVFEKFFRQPYRQSSSNMTKFYSKLKDFQSYKKYYFSTQTV